MPKYPDLLSVYQSSSLFCLLLIMSTLKTYAPTLLLNAKSLKPKLFLFCKNFLKVIPVFYISGVDRNLDAVNEDNFTDNVKKVIADL
jgi:hypothetical protein